MTPDTKRLSVLQAVAQGYCPITQEDAEQEICKGNQSTELILNTKSLEIVVVIV